VGTRPATQADIGDCLATIVGVANVARAGENRDYLARDIFFDGAPAAFVVRPRNKQEVADIVRMAGESGFALFPRGGGMSYTRAYMPSVDRSILLDMSALDRIVTIDETNMFVTAEAGVTWKQLYEALRPLGLRLPVFGTMSGANATVGGGLSQGSIFYGSAQYGTSADHVLGLEVALADGTLVRTGQAATRNAKPFFRWHGPDLTGPFLGDAGALGIKVEMSFRLIRLPENAVFLSYGFDDYESVWLTQNAIAQAGIAGDCFSFDAVMQHQLLERNSLIDNAQALRKVVSAGGSLLRGLRDAALIVSGGKGFLDDVPFSLHMVIEHRLPGAAAAMAAEAKAIAMAQGGRALPDSVPRLMRAEPFPSMDMTLGPSGERWVPVHGLFALSDGLEAMRRLQNLLAGYAPRMIEHHILSGILSNPVGASAMIIEALFYWPDSPHALHEKIVAPDKLASARKFTRHAEAQALVGEIRGAILDCFADLGSAPFGIGKTIPYRENRDPGSYRLLEAVKRAVDPHGMMNPGALGLQ
jgi:FAD/FMN-containing dehydrogenase